MYQVSENGHDVWAIPPFLQSLTDCHANLPSRHALARKYCDLTISQNQDLRPIHFLLRQKLEYYHQNTLYVYGMHLYSLLTSEIL